MKNLIVIYFLLPLAIYSQVDISFGSRMFNPSIINPANAGLNGNKTIFIEHQQRMIGFEGAPTISNISYNGNLFSERLGTGIHISNNENGALSRIDLSVDLAYTVRLSYDFFASFGVKSSVARNNANLSLLTLFDPSDLIRIEQYNQTAEINLTPGIFIYSDKFFIEAAVPLFSNSRAFQNGSNSNEIELQTAYLYTSAGFKFKPFGDFEIIPSATYMANLNLDKIVEASLVSVFPEYFFGLSVRKNSHFSMIAGLNILDSISLGYTYEYATSALSEYVSNSHILFLKINLDSRMSNLISPRF